MRLIKYFLIIFAMVAIVFLWHVVVKSLSESTISLESRLLGTRIKYSYIRVLDITTGRKTKRYKKRIGHLWYPQIIDNYLLLNWDDSTTQTTRKIYAYNINTNKLLWESDACGHGAFKQRYRNKGKIHDGDIIYVRNANRVSAVYLKTGISKWEFKIDTATHFQAISLSDDLILAKAQLTGQIYGIEKLTGKLKWTIGGLKSIFHVSQSTNNTTLILNNSNKLIAINNENGKEFWQLPYISRVSDIYFNGVFVLRNHSDRKKDMFEYISISEGKTIWKMPISTHCISTLLANNRLILKDKDNLYCLNPKDGKIFWIKKINADLNAYMISSNKVIYLAPHSGTHAYAIKLDTGDIIWEKDTRLVYCNIEQSGDNILFISRDSICCLRAPNGSVKWRWKVPKRKLAIFTYDISSAKKEIYLNLIPISLLPMKIDS